MQLTSGTFGALLQTLRLTQGLYKPTPSPAGPSTYKTLAGDRPSAYDDNPGDYYGSASSEDSCDWVPPYDTPDLGSQAFPPFDPAKATVYRYRQQQSVNLGSWFVHEAWMTPSPFSCAAGDQLSELDIASGWGSTEGARAVLERHWDTFINESDFQYLASIGINTVRLPIGYWSLGPDFCDYTPYASVADVYRNSWSRIMRTINLAGSVGIGVLVDLHGAPGSQNGQQHSGVSDGATNLFDSPQYTNQTITVLTYLMQQLAWVTNVVGIQVLNEPQNVPSLADFYTQAIDAMRGVYPESNLPLYIHDGFDLERFSAFVANRQDFVVQDHHSYFVFTSSDASEPASDHLSDIKGGIGDSLRTSSDQQRRNLVIDEFSCALTDDSLSDEPDRDQARQDFCTGQVEIYGNATAGWSFWAYRKEQCADDPGWCFTAAVGKALPSTFFSYGTPTSQEPSKLPDMSTLTAGMPSPPLMQGASSADTLYQPFPGPQENSEAPASSEASTGNSPASPSSSPAEEASSSRGYTDGFLTARIFSLYSLSKLGFVGQYIQDSITALGPSVVAPGTEDAYHEGFLRGLNDGEAVVYSSLGQGHSY